MDLPCSGILCSIEWYFRTKVQGWNYHCMLCKIPEECRSHLRHEITHRIDDDGVPMARPTSCL